MGCTASVGVLEPIVVRGSQSLRKEMSLMKNQLIADDLQEALEIHLIMSQSRNVDIITIDKKWYSRKQRVDFDGSEASITAVNDSA